MWRLSFVQAIASGWREATLNGLLKSKTLLLVLSASRLTPPSPNCFVTVAVAGSMIEIELFSCSETARRLLSGEKLTYSGWTSLGAWKPGVSVGIETLRLVQSFGSGEETSRTST